jgi:hypothetical protein
MRHRRQTWVWAVLFSIGGIGTANAQGRFDCRAQPTPRIGVSAGNSSGHLGPTVELVREEPHSSVTVGDGAQLAGRAELGVAGPLWFRLEAARARWDVRRTFSDPAGGLDFTRKSIGSMTERHLAALMGVNFSHNGQCIYVSAGGGLYSVAFRDASARAPGWALGAGWEYATGARGAIQLDATFHVINSRGSDWRTLTTSGEIGSLSLLVGWAYRY